MLQLEKQKDIAVLKTIGYSEKQIRKVFFALGGMVGFSGAILGVSVGVGLVLLQQHFEFFTISEDIAYPTKLKISDFIVAGLCIVFVTVIASYRPAIKSAKVKISEHL